jgi:glycosyltransferase involved in cell wall biosynthesis
VSSASSPTISVGIPTFNRPDLLKGALTTVLAQSYRDLEVTVVDNGSTHETINALDQLADPRVRVRRNPETIPRTENYNIALEAGSGTYVAILADDDEWMPEFLMRTAQLLDDHPDIALVHTGYDVIDPAGEIRYTVTQPAPLGAAVVSGPDYLRWLLSGRHRIEFTGTLLRRRDLPAGGFRAEDDVADDIGLLLRVATHGNVAFVNEPLARVRFHDSTVSTTGGNLLLDDRYQRSIAYRAACTEVKLRFLAEHVDGLSEHRELLKTARRSLRQHLLVPAARALRPPRDLRGALRSAIADSAYDRWSLVDPVAWKQAVAAYRGRAA